jgi:hypothetical protein
MDEQNKSAVAAEMDVTGWFHFWDKDGNLISSVKWGTQKSTAEDIERARLEAEAVGFKQENSDGQGNAHIG